MMWWVHRDSSQLSWAKCRTTGGGHKPGKLRACPMNALPANLPSTLAVVDDESDFSDCLADDLRQRGVHVRVFNDSNALVADRSAYDFGFYVVDLSLPGIDGVELIRILRLRTSVGILVVSGRLAPDVFEKVITAGADMYLAKPVRIDQVVVAIQAVQRRATSAQDQAATWRLDSRNGELTAPDGVRVALSGTDLAIMSCFVDAKGDTVPRETLSARLGRAAGQAEGNTLHATIYRLRRRIERATPGIVPLQSQSRVGYVFKAPLVAV